MQPIVGIDGGHYLNSVTFDAVRVPARNLIGEEGKGWGLAKFILGNERLSYAHVARKREDLKILKARARDILNGPGSNAPLPSDFAARIAAYEIELDHLEMSVLKVLSFSPARPASARAKRLLSTTRSPTQRPKSRASSRMITGSTTPASPGTSTTSSRSRCRAAI